jgi:hypothetical protein
MVVSVEEKASSRGQVRTKKVSDERTTVSVDTFLQVVSKVGSKSCSTSSRGATCVLPRWHPAYRWHELGLGSEAERGNSAGNGKRKPYKWSPRKGKVSMSRPGADSPVVVKNLL